MDGHNGASPRSYAAFEFGGIDVVGVRTDVRENWLSAKSADGASRGHKCKRWQEHFVSGLNTACAQSQDQRVCSRSQADTVSYAAEPGNLFLESGSFEPQHELLRGHDAIDSRANLGTNHGVLRRKIKLRYGLKKRIGL